MQVHSPLKLVPRCDASAPLIRTVRQPARGESDNIVAWLAIVGAVAILGFATLVHSIATHGVTTVEAERVIAERPCGGKAR